MLKEGHFDMNLTCVYFVRHAESLFVKGQERTRGLSHRGFLDAQKVKYLLVKESIDYIYSSPYKRSIQTVQPLSNAIHKEIIVKEDLRERLLAGDGLFTSDTFQQSKKIAYEDMNYSFCGGESSKAAQKRAMQVLTKIMNEHQGMNIVIGTHGDIMTLMMNYFDQGYDFNFWKSTSMPDIYKLQFKVDKLIEVKRLWG